MTCLENIIGLSRTDCNCFDTDKPADFNTSLSGYFLDEMEGLNLSMMSEISNCENGSLWDMLVKARSNAILDFKGDLLAQMSIYNKAIFDSTNYIVGSSKHEGVFNFAENLAGVKIYPKPIREGVLKINRVGVLFNCNTTANVHIYSDESSTPIHSFTINTTANQVSYSSVLNYELPMAAANGEYLQYYVVYEKPIGCNALLNKIGCGCNGFKTDFCNPPCWGNYQSIEQKWANYLMIGGVKGNDLPTLESSGVGSNYTNGIVLDFKFKCDVSNVICNNLDFDNGGLPMAIAKSIQYKAAYNLLAYVNSSGNINRFTLLSQEALYGKMNHYRKEYNDRLMWLSQNIETTQSGCYICEKTMIKSSIFA